jgi:hypothetical protein
MAASEANALWPLEDATANIPQIKRIVEMAEPQIST